MLGTSLLIPWASPGTASPAAGGARGRQVLPTKGHQSSELGDDFLWQAEELVKAQQHLSTFLPDKQNTETNHHKPSLLPSVGRKRKRSLVSVFFPSFFFFFSPFANKNHFKKSPSLQFLPPSPDPSLWIQCVAGTHLCTAAETGQNHFPIVPSPSLLLSPWPETCQHPRDRQRHDSRGTIAGAEPQGSHASAWQGMSWGEQRGR